MFYNNLAAVYIKLNKIFLTSVALMGITTSVAYASVQNEADMYRLELDKVKVGQLPAGWQVSATNPDGPLAQWAVEADTSSPKQEKILSIVRIQDTSSSVFNLNWSKQRVFLNGELTVRLRANGGKEDQGGGIIWRVLDENNYYLARYNPLENNFRLYYVEDGQRTTLATASRLASKVGAWNQLRIKHNGQRIQGWFNNTLAWEINDAQLSKPGGVGLWSKADAASSFADFEFRTELVKKPVVVP